MNYLKYITLLLCTCILTSCNDFLDESPSKTTAIVPETLDQLEALLDNYNMFYPESSNELIFSTDDYGFETDLYDAANSTYEVNALAFGVWDSEYLAELNSRIYWPVEWQKVFTANLVLKTIESVEGTLEEKNQIKAECHFIRAYSYFKLATVYCLPYTETNKSELGLPLKKTTSFEESVSRSTLQETYAFIEEDLMQALELTRSFSKINDFNNSWRASTAAVNGFAARYYLALNDYVTAQSFAQDALNEYAQLRNYNTEMSFSTIPNEVTIFNPNPEQVKIEYPYTHDQQSVVEDRLAFGELYYFRMLKNDGWKYWPSQELLDLYDKTYDLRYKYHMVENYSYDRGAVNPPYSYPGYIFFFKSDLPSGPSVPEMILIKAECQIRLGNFNEGIQTVNQLRAARIDANAPTSIIELSAVSQADALSKVLEERRREMPFVHRWYDIRRYNNNEDSSDNVTVTRTFYPYNSSTILGSETPQIYSLEENSRRYAFPLPTADIIASEGVLEQNHY
ncbi:RagB/SusD family nutrient uptake outer membrane protein [Formosa haliotis]|uniref:RagB/SusD family nutrient uptake outer membrane protein n=1 Tax=Formosa haliotis TaxID=1555194 RepID=UPI000824E5D0|nr:RagB/SusD family nutrient uptake outer membrane protein [Formosa haliotis]